MSASIDSCLCVARRFPSDPPAASPSHPLTMCLTLTHSHTHTHPPTLTSHHPHPGIRLVEIRAAQRTFEGAYMRTALSQFSFALVVLRIFTSEFYPIGALLACYGAAVLLVAAYRRYEGNRQFFDCEESEGSSADEDDAEQLARGRGRGTGRGPAVAAGSRERGSRQMVVKKKFRTSGNSVGLLVGLSLVSYLALVVLLWQLDG